VALSTHAFIGIIRAIFAGALLWSAVVACAVVNEFEPGIENGKHVCKRSDQDCTDAYYGPAVLLILYFIMQVGMSGAHLVQLSVAFCCRPGMCHRWLSSTSETFPLCCGTRGPCRRVQFSFQLVDLIMIGLNEAVIALCDQHRELIVPAGLLLGGLLGAMLITLWTHLLLPVCFCCPCEDADTPGGTDGADANDVPGGRGYPTVATSLVATTVDDKEEHLPAIPFSVN
jgi:hypothetical protein